MPIKSKNILIVGPHFIVNNKVIGEGGKLYYLLQNEGYNTFIVSKYRNKILRLLDTIFFMLMKNKHYDIVMLQCYGQLAFILEDITTIIAKILGKKIIITIHGGAFVEFYQNKKFWVKKVLNRANVITTPSKFLQDKLNNEFNLPIIYLPNAITLNNFSFNPNIQITGNEIRVLWIRGFHDIYHPEIAILTLKEMIMLGYNATLTMVGKDNGTLYLCKKLAKDLGINERVFFTGFIPNDKLNQIYHNHHILLTTTHYESFGVSLFEAAACGTPNIAIPVGELPYLWENNHDITFVRRDPKEIANSIISLLTDTLRKSNQINNAYEKSKIFNLNRLKTNWLKII